MKLGDVWMRPFFNPIQDVYRSTLHIFIVLILGFLSLQIVNAATPDFSKVVDTTQDSFLPVEQAFSLKVQPDQNQAALNLKWTIAPNYSLYRDRIHVEVFTPKDVTIDTSELAGHMVWKQDPNFGRVAVFHDAATMKVGITHLGSSQPETVQIKLRYQGCADSGLCFPPVDEVLTIHPKGLKLVSATSIKKLNTTLETISPVKNKDENYDLNNASSLAAFLNHASVPLILLTLLVLGAGLAFTPCVFPMMPILSGLIAGEKSERLTGWRGFKLSLAYVLGMAVCYAIMGTLMGYFGAKANLQLWLQSPAVLISFAILFIVLAFGMFGVYTLQLPHFVQNKLDRFSQQQKGGRIGSVALMGALSALVVSPCVSAPLAGVLVYISATGDALLGGMALFSLGLGMGIPLIILGTTSAKLLPRSGSWMEQIKSIFGVGLIAVAIWLLSRVWTGSVTLWMWGALLGGYGVWLGAFEQTKNHKDRLIKAFGLGLSVLALFLWIGAATGQDDPLHPLAALSHTAVSPDTTKPANVIFETVSQPQALQALLDQAKQNKQTVVIDVSADWCAACQVMERSTFRDSRVIEAFSKYKRIRFDMSESSQVQKEWLQAMHLYGPPALIFIDNNGNELKSLRVQGEIEADKLIAHLK